MTGGASGIGAAILLLLAEEGAVLAILGRDPPDKALERSDASRVARVKIGDQGSSASRSPEPVRERRMLTNVARPGKSAI